MTKALISVTLYVELPEPISVQPLAQLARHQNTKQRALAYAKGLTNTKLLEDLKHGRCVLASGDNYCVFATEIE